MFPLQNAGSVAVIAPASTATNATASGNIDTLGYDEVKVCVLLDSAGATSSNPSVLKLAESDDTVVTNFADITGFVGDATDGFTVPAADTDDPQVVELNVDCRARKRYLKVSITPAGAAQIVGAVAVLGKADDSTAAAAKAAVSVSG
jgi:hypothetical protein